MRSISRLQSRTRPLFSTRGFFVVDDALRTEVRRTITDPRNRAAVYSLLEKTASESCDLTDVLKGSETRDPFKMVEKEIGQLNQGILSLVANKHPLLSLMAQYYFQVPGKRFRPTVVLLMGQACGAMEARPSQKHIELAEIIEMIHTASLAHDDVLDEADMRRSQQSINGRFGNKFSILVGDFLLARASMALAGLRNHEVTHLLSNMLGELVEGEFVQLRVGPQCSVDTYLRKTYLKTASMLRNAARSAALLSEADTTVVEGASSYGEALGMAFQIVDDLLDLQPSGTGKPANADLKGGLATLPLLLAAEEDASILEAVSALPEQPEQLDAVLLRLHTTQGVQRAHEVAKQYCEQAMQALQALPPSHSRDVLAELPQRILTRKH